MGKQGSKTGRSPNGNKSPNDRPKQRNKPTNLAAELCHLGTKSGKNSPQKEMSGVLPVSSVLGVSPFKA